MAKIILLIIFVLNVICIIALISVGKYFQCILNIAAALLSIYVYEDIKND